MILIDESKLNGEKKYRNNTIYQSFKLGINSKKEMCEIYGLSITRICQIIENGERKERLHKYIIKHKKMTKTLSTFPIITKGMSEEIEYKMRFEKNVRKTIEHAGIYYDIRKMTDEEAEKVWEELHVK